MNTIKFFQIKSLYEAINNDSLSLSLDPFLGSGTTAIAAIKEGRHYIGFELNREYYNDAEWPKIKAIVIDSGEEIMVDDHAIDFFGTSYYNMWHNTANGTTYHDDELEFIDERLQKV